MSINSFRQDFICSMNHLLHLKVQQESHLILKWQPITVCQPVLIRGLIHNRVSWVGIFTADKNITALRGYTKQVAPWTVTHPCHICQVLSQKRKRKARTENHTLDRGYYTSVCMWVLHFGSQHTLKCSHTSVNPINL